MKKCMLTFPYDFAGDKMALVKTDDRPTVVVPDGFIPKGDNTYECRLFPAAKETVIIMGVMCNLMLAKLYQSPARFKNGTPKVCEQLAEMAKKWRAEKKTILFRKF